MGKETISLDLDWFYRVGGHFFVRGICQPFRFGQEVIQYKWTRLIQRANENLESLLGEQKFLSIGQPLLYIVGGSVLVSLAILVLL